MMGASVSGDGSPSKQQISVLPCLIPDPFAQARHRQGGSPGGGGGQTEVSDPVTGPKPSSLSPSTRARPPHPWLPRDPISAGDLGEVKETAVNGLP